MLKMTPSTSDRRDLRIGRNLLNFVEVETTSRRILKTG
jgi:hypothetical protein